MYLGLAKKSDLEALHQLELQSFSTDRLTHKNYEKLLQNKKNALVFILKHNDDLIGSAVVLLQHKTKQARLFSFAIDSKFRGKNFTYRLYDYVEGYIRDIGFQQMILEVRVDNAPAIRLYQKAGFTQIGIIEKFYEDGANAIQMEKDLV